MENNKIVFVITAFNEENTISNVISNCRKFGDVFIIDDCSTDSTNSILKKLNVNYITNRINIGYEKSLMKCINYVFRNFNYDFIISVDADDQFDLKSISQASAQIEKHKLIISSIRNKKNRYIEIIIDRLFLFFFNIRDPLSGLKIYNRKLLELSNPYDLSGLLGMNYILFSKIKEIKIYQFNIDVKNRVGKSTFGGAIKSNIYILMSLFKFLYKYVLFKRKYG